MSGWGFPAEMELKLQSCPCAAVWADRPSQNQVSSAWSTGEAAWGTMLTSSTPAGVNRAASTVAALAEQQYDLQAAFPHCQDLLEPFRLSRCVLLLQDEDEEVYKRDFSAPTLEDHFNKTILPKVMQVGVLAEGAQLMCQGVGVLGRGEQQVLHPS